MSWLLARCILQTVMQLTVGILRFIDYIIGWWCTVWSVQYCSYACEPVVTGIRECCWQYCCCRPRDKDGRFAAGITEGPGLSDVCLSNVRPRYVKTALQFIRLYRVPTFWKIRECQGILFWLECQGIVREFCCLSGNFLHSNVVCTVVYLLK